jgi:hypothetical protein
MGFSSRMELSHPEEYALWPGRSDDLLTDLNDPDKTITIARTSDDMLPDGSGWARGDRDQLIDTTTGQNPTSADSWWTKTNVTIDDDGGIVAADDDDENHDIRKALATDAANNTYIFSAKFKKGELNWARLNSYNATDGSKNVSFDLENGVIGAVNGSPVSYGMDPIDSDGYYRCWVVWTITDAGTTYYIYPAESDSDLSYSDSTGNPLIYVKEIMLEEVPSDLALGAELLGDPGFEDWDGSDDLQNSWTENSEDANNYFTEHANGVRIVSDNSTAVFLSQPISFTSGETYQFTFVKSDHVSGSIRFSVRNQADDGNLVEATTISGSDTNGTFEYFYVSGSTETGTIKIWRDNAGNTDYVMNSTSIKEVPISVWTDALGPELVTNGDFADGDTGWTVPAGWSTSSSAALHSGAAGTLKTDSSIAVSGTRYYWSFDVSGRTDGGMTIKLGGDNTNDQLYGNLTTNGTFSGVHTVDTTGSFDFYANAAFDGAIDNVTVKELGHFIQPSPYTNVSTIPAEGVYLDGWHYVQNTTVLNLLPYSNDFDEWTLGANDTVTAGQLSPDGNYNAYRFTTTNTSHNCRYQIDNLSPETDYTFSIFVLDNGSPEYKTSIYDVTNSANIIAPTSYLSSLNQSSFTRLNIPFTTPAGCTSVNVYGVRGFWYSIGRCNFLRRKPNRNRNGLPTNPHKRSPCLHHAGNG